MSKISSELEARATSAIETLETVAKTVVKAQESSNRIKESLKETIKDAVDLLKEAPGKSTEQYYVFESGSDKVISGSEKMWAVGGGIKARIGKTKEGKTVIVEYMFDKDRFDEKAAASWLKKNSKTLEKSLSSVQENFPLGSFQDITIRLQNALMASTMFPVDDYGYSTAYICYVFPDYFVVDYAGKYYSIDYSEKKGVFNLSTPKEVAMDFVAKEAQALNAKHTRRNTPDIQMTESIRFKINEDSMNESKKELVAVLIEAGKNFSKKRYYPKSTIQESAGLYAGLKNYIDHPTAKEEMEKPERSIEQWVSTIVESWYEDGKAMGRIKVHNDEFWAKLQDPVFKENIGLSINASGKRYYKQIDGVNMEVIEAILAPKSVDWVTEPGARGRVDYLLESEKKEGDKKMLETVTLKDLKESRKDLVSEIVSETKTAIAAETDAKIKEAVDNAIKPYKESDSKKKSDSRMAKVKEAVDATKLHAKAKARVIESLSSKCSDEKLSDADFEKSVKESVASEMDYLKEVAGIKVGSGTEASEPSSEVTSIVESFTTKLGLKKDKKEEEK